jgi:hypothetical protein
MRIIASDDQKSAEVGKPDHRWWCQYLLDDGWVYVGPFRSMQDAKDHELGEAIEP